ncbi:RMD1 family protein [Neptunicella marina]|uniref:RMD1 family protein n=1 Tax=Neptunicella marina TaxID=2125989 RepID=A0A8J6IWE7_9ALTE|nr:RMD1 family protein [Neptunicella marina]MBC3767791.1 RMD1 family protein [Neptunicella marina]
MSFCNDRVSAINLGNLFTDNEHYKSLLDNERGTRYRDALHIALPGGEAWIFDYGVLIFWAVSEDERMALFNRLQFDHASLKADEQEHFRFEAQGTDFKISQDKIVLTNDDKLTRLAISHALAQSLKLNEYESQAQRTIQDNAHLPKTLANSGKISLSRKEIAKIRGHLFSTKSDIILHYELLDTPNFFWEYPEYEATYNIAARYLEIHPRVEILSKKLATIHELFDMLADEQKHQHSAFLEWIIIILIAFEIVMFGAQELQTLLG